MRIAGSQKQILINRQSGYSLIEIMVAMVLAMIIIAGVGMVFVSSKQTFRLNNSISEVHDNGRFALNFLIKDIQKAGWVDSDALSNDGYSLTEPFKNLTDNTSNNTAQGKVAMVNGDSFTVRYYGERDCDGDLATDGIVENNYQLVATQNMPELQCNGISLMKNIETFQVLYGIEDAAGLRYVKATGVNDISLLRSIQVAFTLASDANHVLKKDNKTITKVLDEGPFEFDDGRYRQVFTSTIAIQNQGLRPPQSLLVTE